MVKSIVDMGISAHEQKSQTNTILRGCSLGQEGVFIWAKCKCQDAGTTRLLCGINIETRRPNQNIKKKISYIGFFCGFSGLFRGGYVGPLVNSWPVLLLTLEMLCSAEQNVFHGTTGSLINS